MSALTISAGQRKKDYNECLSLPADNRRMYIYRLEHCLQSWLSASKVPETYDGLFAHLILHKLYDILPGDFAIYVRDQYPTTPDKAATSWHQDPTQHCTLSVSLTSRILRLLKRRKKKRKNQIVVILSGHIL